jgi:hypothetical protein
MRAAIARAMISLLILSSIGAALSACRHTAEGVKQDFHRDTR